jgi:hypothetical protein
MTIQTTLSKGQRIKLKANITMIAIIHLHLSFNEHPWGKLYSKVIICLVTKFPLKTTHRRTRLRQNQNLKALQGMTQGAKHVEDPLQADVLNIRKNLTKVRRFHF